MDERLLLNVGLDLVIHKDNKTYEQNYDRLHDN